MLALVISPILRAPCAMGKNALAYIHGAATTPSSSQAEPCAP